MVYFKLQAAPKDRYGVDITPMTYIPGAKIERYLGNLNFFFIRESTCIREVKQTIQFLNSLTINNTIILEWWFKWLCSLFCC